MQSLNIFTKYLKAFCCFGQPYLEPSLFLKSLLHPLTSIQCRFLPSFASTDEPDRLILNVFFCGHPNI